MLSYLLTVSQADGHAHVTTYFVLSTLAPHTSALPLYWTPTDAAALCDVMVGEGCAFRRARSPPSGTNFHPLIFITLLRSLHSSVLSTFSHNLLWYSKVIVHNSILSFRWKNLFWGTYLLKHKNSCFHKMSVRSL